MDIREVFGRNMRKFRLAKELSQEALAERMGVDRAHVSSMERGRQNVTLLTIWHAAQALDRKVAEFLDENIVNIIRQDDEKAPRKRRTKIQATRRSK